MIIDVTIRPADDPDAVDLAWESFLAKMAPSNSERIDQVLAALLFCARELLPVGEGIESATVTITTSLGRTVRLGPILRGK